jgi:hypothetical protein
MASTRLKVGGRVNMHRESVEFSIPREIINEFVDPSVQEEILLNLPALTWPIVKVETIVVSLGYRRGSVAQLDRDQAHYCNCIVTVLIEITFLIFDELIQNFISSRLTDKTLTYGGSNRCYPDEIGLRRLTHNPPTRVLPV